MKTKNMINEEAIEKVMGLYDKNIVAAIESSGQKNLKGTIKGLLFNFNKNKNFKNIIFIL